MNNEPQPRRDEKGGFWKAIIRDAQLSPLLTTIVLGFVCLLAVCPVFLFHWHVKPLVAIGLFALIMVAPFIPVCHFIERWRSHYARRYENESDAPR